MCGLVILYCAVSVVYSSSGKIGLDVLLGREITSGPDLNRFLTDMRTLTDYMWFGFWRRVQLGCMVEVR